LALAKQYSTLFRGTSFLKENATENVFKNSTKEHKIIHIGTHAESNNISPELSRLIFAKNIFEMQSDEDNSLYTYEIYNCNLASNLTILTACETGKPTYQSRVGMISLAHAFNYVGSESLLTSLWKIDEQSSVTIVESFYKYLMKNLSKDEALRRAKLDYIAAAEGRIANPQYWAGLIIMGDVSPVELDSRSLRYLFILGIVIIFIAGLFIFSKISRSR